MAFVPVLKLVLGIDFCIIFKGAETEKKCFKKYTLALFSLINKKKLPCKGTKVPIK